MKKLSYVLAALATIAVAAPTIASAEEFGFGSEVGRSTLITTTARVLTSMHTIEAGTVDGTIAMATAR